MKMDREAVISYTTSMGVAIMASTTNLGYPDDEQRRVDGEVQDNVILGNDPEGY